MRPSRPFVLLSLLQVLVTGLAGVVAVDLVVGRLDVGARGTVEGLHVPDARLGWTNRPGYTDEQIHVNSLGLRGPEPDGRDAARLLFLGDSRIFGAGVQDEDTWAARLEQRLAAQVEGVSVLNGAVNAYSTVQACRRGILLLPVVEPDLVVLFISPGWNLLDNSSTGDWVRVGDAFVPAEMLEGWPRALHGLVARAQDLLARSSIYVRHRAVRRASLFGPGVRHFVLSRADPGPAAVHVERARQALRELRAATSERGIELLALLLPEAYQCGPLVWERYLRQHGAEGAPPPGTDQLEPMAALRDLVESIGIPSRMLFTDVARLVADEPRYYLDDFDHWSPAGHAAMARAVEGHLTQGGLLDEVLDQAGGARR